MTRLVATCQFSPLRILLVCQELEPRCVPALWRWNPLDGNNWVMGAGGGNPAIDETNWEIQRPNMTWQRVLKSDTPFGLGPWPSSLEDVLFPASINAPCVVNVAVRVHSLTIESGHTSPITLQSDLILDGGLIANPPPGGNISSIMRMGSGTIVGPAGKLILVG